MKRILTILCAVVVLLCGCSSYDAQNEGSTDGNAKKEQYAILHNYENDADMTIQPSNEYYDTAVEQLTYAAVEEDQVDISSGMTLLKSLTFYQAPTQTATSSGEDDGAEPIIYVKIYTDGSKQYAVGKINPISDAQSSFEMTAELIETIDSMEQLALQR